jgi:cyanophycinase-like exopeptidase
VTLVHGFLEIPQLKGIITDSHFVKRDRMGRLLVFLFRLNEPDGKVKTPQSFPVRGIGIDQGAALLVEPDGNARAVGAGNIYLVMQTAGALVAKHGDALTGLKAAAEKVAPGQRFNILSWKGDGIGFALKVQGRRVVSNQPGGSLY